MRPEYHFTAQGWINDPHGITFSEGVYHVFYQNVPGATSWSLACSWGHASGPDLFSLQERAPALTPGDGDDGVWSGSLQLTADGSPRIFYTSVSADRPDLGRIRTATATDSDWITWEKGPVVAEAPTDLDVQMFRDPVVIADERGWRMLVGAGLTDGAAAAVGFSSADGVSWHPDGLVAARPVQDRDPVWAGTMWECPQIIEIDGQHALIVSVWDQNVLYDVLYALGTFHNGTFVASQWGQLGFGPSPYAATVFRDRANQPCLMFWLRDVAGTDWAGAHSIPYRLAIEEGALTLSPHPDLDRYRDEDAVSGRAADILWPERVDTAVQVVQQGDTVLEITRDRELLHIRIGEHSSRVPWVGDVRIVLDGPIVEVCSRAGVFAAPITPLTADWELLGSGLNVRRLRQHALTEPRGSNRLSGH